MFSFRQALRSRSNIRDGAAQATLENNIDVPEERLLELLFQDLLG